MTRLERIRKKKKFSKNFKKQFNTLTNKEKKEIKDLYYSGLIFEWWFKEDQEKIELLLNDV